MKCVNLNGEVIKAMKGYSALIETEGRVLRTSNVESVAIIKDKIMIETQNTRYFITK